MMRYFVCDVDGALYLRTVSGVGWLAQIEQEVGPEGFATVRIRSGPYVGQLAGYVNDCGLVLPDKYARNAVGTCLLASLGASVQPYAGPVVITGWDDSSWDEIEIRDVSDALIPVVEQVHADIRIALGLDVGRDVLGDHRSEWAATMRQLATWAADAPVPAMQIITDLNDIRAHLRGE